MHYITHRMFYSFYLWKAFGMIWYERSLWAELVNEPDDIHLCQIDMLHSYQRLTTKTGNMPISTNTFTKLINFSL